MRVLHLISRSAVLCMLSLLPVLAGGAAAAERLSKLPTGLLTAEELAHGWIALFDGTTLFGWEPSGKADWSVKDGAIVVSQGEKSLLCTTSRFADYELKVDFRSAAGTNSGIFLRTPLQPIDPAADCYELNIAPPDNPFPTGSFVKRQKADAVPDSRDWQTFHARVEGPTLRVSLNGTQVCEYRDPKPIAAGRIGLQLNEGRVEFRQIKLRPLGARPIFNGQDLTGWKTYPQMASKFSVTSAGELHVVNGKGQLETTGQYANFLLQLECISHARQLNSGIFLRCIPGEEMNGYESQIHNGYVDGDRTKPVDCGTGGIFRRQNARIVAADDNQWFTKTIVADGPHFATWVNGIQVADWTDTRKPDPNPRRGLRLAAGTLMIQGHDPTTNLSFRNLRITELP